MCSVLISSCQGQGGFSKTGTLLGGAAANPVTPNQQDLHVHWDAAALWDLGWLYHSPGDRRQHGDNS